MGKSTRRIHVKPQRKRKPDYRKIGAALQAHVAAQAEVDAEATGRPEQLRRSRGGQR